MINWCIEVEVLAWSTCETIAYQFVTLAFVWWNLSCCAVVNCFTGFTSNCITTQLNIAFFIDILDDRFLCIFNIGYNFYSVRSSGLYTWHSWDNQFICCVTWDHWWCNGIKGIICCCPRTVINVSCYQVDISEALEAKCFWHIFFRFWAIFVDIFHSTSDIIFVNNVFDWIWPFWCIWIVWINWFVWSWSWFVWIDWFDTFTKNNGEFLVKCCIKVKVLVWSTCEAITYQFVTLTFVWWNLSCCTIVDSITWFTKNLITTQLNIAFFIDIFDDRFLCIFDVGYSFFNIRRSRFNPCYSRDHIFISRISFDSWCKHRVKCSIIWSPLAIIYMTGYQVNISETFKVKCFSNIVLRFWTIFINIMDCPSYSFFIDNIFDWIWPFWCIWIIWINWFVWGWGWFIWIDWFDTFTKRYDKFLIHWCIKVKVFIDRICETIIH